MYRSTNVKFYSSYGTLSALKLRFGHGINDIQVDVISLPDATS